MKLRALRSRRREAACRASERPGFGTCDQAWISWGMTGTSERQARFTFTTARGEGASASGTGAMKTAHRPHERKSQERISNPQDWTAVQSAVPAAISFRSRTPRLPIYGRGHTRPRSPNGPTAQVHAYITTNLQ